MLLKKAQSNLYKLVDEIADSHQPITIVGKRSNIVVVDKSDWRSMQETIPLLSIPGMRESIRSEMNEPINKSSRNPGW